MSAFSEYFDFIRKQRDMNCVEAANRCGVDPAVMYKWFKGEHVPKDWNVLEPVCEKLQLSSVEKQVLRCAYEKTVFGEEKYLSYQKIFELLERLPKRREEYHEHHGNERIKVHIDKLPHFVELHNKMEVLQYIRDVLIYLQDKEEKKLYLKVQPLQKEIFIMIRLFLGRTQGCELEELVYFAHGDYQSRLDNLDVVMELMDLFVTNHKIEIYSKERRCEAGEVLENWILSDDFALEFADDFSYGMFTTDPEWITFFRTCYERIKESSNALGKMLLETPANGLKIIDSDCGYCGTVEYMPCVGICLTKEILQKHLYEEIPGREELIAQCLTFSEAINENYIKDGITVFFMEGLIEFMETGRVEVFPYEVYRPLDMESRCEILRRAIEITQQGIFAERLAKPDMMSALKGVLVQYYEGETGCVFIEMHFPEGRIERIELYLESVKEEFKNFFLFLEDSAYVYTVEETVEILKKVLKKYEQKM